MSSFSDLPNEMITEIWSHVLEPKDVESFARTRKAYASAPEFLREHNRLKRKYSILSSKEDVRCGTIANFLEDILSNPRVALYLDHVSLETWRNKWDDPTTLGGSNTDNLHLPYPEERMQLFEEAVETSAFVPESEAATWIADIRKGDETTILALIMTLCPNVRLFGLDGWGCGGDRLSKTIRRIGKSPTTKALSCLTDVKIGWIYAGMNEFNWVKTFSFLKSVKSFYGFLIGQLQVGFHCWYLSPSRWSNVTSLYLEKCNIGHQQLYIYLRCINTLETFSYQPVIEDREDPTPFCPFWLCTALTAHAGHSLKKLELVSLDGLGTHMDSLTGLNVLKKLHTEYKMLMDDNPEVYSENLVDKLPSSIEKVTLEHYDRYNINKLQSQILKTCELKAQRLPKLKKLNYRINETTFKGKKRLQQFEAYLDESDIISTLTDRCKEVGVELHIDQIDHK